MNILIYGTGVLGSQYAARLQAAGHAVTVLARGQRLADLRRHGIVVEDWYTGERTTTMPRIVEALHPEDAYDVCLVIMGAHQTGATLPVLAANQHIPTIAFLGNNVAGADAYVAALGRDRVLIGFAGAAGTLEGHVVRGVVVPPGRHMPIGEPDGPITGRVLHLCADLNAAGLAAVPSTQADAWLKTHAALILPVAGALAMADDDLIRLASTRDALVWGVRAFRENIRTLRAMGIPIVPRQIDVISRVAEPVLVAWMARILRHPRMAVGFAHAHKAHPEMRHLAADLVELAERAGVWTPMTYGLMAFLDGREPPLPAGSADFALDWRDAETGVGVMLGLAAVGLIVWKLLQKPKIGR